MSPAEVGASAAVAGVLVTILSGMAILIYNAGRHSQRLDRVEGDVKDLKIVQDEHGHKLSVLDQLMVLLQEVRGDVKDLLTGAKPVRRRPGEG